MRVASQETKSISVSSHGSISAKFQTNTWYSDF